MDPQAFWEDYQHLQREASKLRSSEERLKGIRARHRALSEVAEELFAIIDQAGVVLDMNPGGLRLLGREASDVIGRDITKIFSDEPSRAVARRASEVIRRDRADRFDWEPAISGGPPTVLDTRLAPVRDDTGRAVAVVVIARDIGDLLTLREDLEAAAESLDDMRKRVDAALRRVRRDPPSFHKPDDVPRTPRR